MIQSAGSLIQFDGDSDTAGNSGSQSKEETETKAVADAEDKGVGYGAGEEAQRAVLPTQEVIGEINATEHIETRTGNADRRNGMVVHASCRTRVRVIMHG